MFPPLELILSGIVGATALLFHYVIKRRESAWHTTVRAWIRTAEELGIEVSSSGNVGRIRLAGSIEGIEATIETDFDHVLGTPITRFTVEMPDVIPTDLRITRLERSRISHRRVELGDAAVDEHLSIVGSEPMILALFKESLRLRALRDITPKTRVEHGTIVREVEGQIVDPHQLVIAVRALISLGNALGIEEKSIDDKLLENVKTEACLGVQRKIYSLLLQPGSTREISDLAARNGLTEEDPFIRMLAALHLGPQNFDQVERIAREETLPHEVRLFAFGHLAARGPLLWSKGFVGRVMRIDGRSAQRAVLRSLVAGKRTDLARAIVDATAETALPAETLFEVSEALARIGDESAELTLLGIIDTSVIALRSSAIRALSRVGTVKAVEPLLMISKNFLEVGEIRDAAKRAIREIQGRIGDADAGRLSVIDPDDERGAVSYALAERGGLSFEET